MEIIKGTSKYDLKRFIIKLVIKFYFMWRMDCALQNREKSFHSSLLQQYSKKKPQIHQHPSMKTFKENAKTCTRGTLVSQKAKKKEKKLNLVQKPPYSTSYYKSQLNERSLPKLIIHLVITLLPMSYREVQFLVICHSIMLANFLF